MSAVAEVDLFDTKTFADGPPHALFDRMRVEEPCAFSHDPRYDLRLWSLTRHSDIRDVSLDKNRFTSERGFLYPMAVEPGSRSHDNVMFNDGPRHDRLRGMLFGAFTPRVVAQFDHWIREICVDIIAKVKELGTFDAVTHVAAELPGQVIASVLGVPDEHRPRIVARANDVFGRLDPEVGPAGALAARGASEDYAFELREMKRSKPGADLATELMDAEGQGGKITDGEYQQSIFSIMLAGFETTHTLIAQSLLLMGRDQKVMDEVYGAPAESIRDIVEEFLRVVSPVNMMARMAREDLEIHGKQIRQGDYVCMWYTAGNRDPNVFADPHTYNYRRGANRHMAFGGGGPHFCIGAHLARLEVQILFDEMRKAGLRLEVDGELRRAKDVAINALRSLPMRVD